MCSHVTLYTGVDPGGDDMPNRANVFFKYNLISFLLLFSGI